MKRIIHIVLISAFIAACSTQEQGLIGTYESDSPGLFEKGWKYLAEGYDGFITGSELELNRDYSFQMITCENIITGEWYAANDTLYLRY